MTLSHTEKHSNDSRLSHKCLKYNKSVRSPEICKIKPVRFCYLTSKNVFWDPIIGIWRKYMVYRCIHSGDGMHWIHSFSSIHVSPSKRNVFMWHYKSIFSAETWTGGGGGGGGEELSPGQGWCRQGLGRGDIENFSKTNHVNKWQRILPLEGGPLNFYSLFEEDYLCFGGK